MTVPIAAVKGNQKMNKFDITYFHGPTPEYIVRPETIADIAAAGITLVPLSADAATIKRALPLLDKFGLKAVVHDERMNDVYWSDDIAGADAAMKSIVGDYAGFDNIVGWDLVDEPSASKFPILAAMVRALRRYSPDCETVINLFPSYASPEQLGTPDYRTHLEQFVNIVDPHYLSYDHYHFLGRESRNAIDSAEIDERERLIRLAAENTEDRAGFFENIEDVRSVAAKYDLAAMLIVLLTEHGPYRNLTRAELFWEVNMCLAYGMKRISYFTYWEPGHDDFWRWTNAMCDTEGNKTRHYEDVSVINRTIRAVGDYLFDKKSAAVFHIGSTEKGTRLFEGYANIKSIAGDHGVLGCFSDGSFYLVNRDFRNAQTFVINADTPLNVFRDGAFARLDSTLITLPAGEAVLIK